MTRDLFVSAYSPRLGNGRDLRTMSIIRALARLRPLDVAYVPHGGAPDPRLAEDPNITLHEVVPSRGAARIGLAAVMRARGWSTGIARSCSPELYRTVRTLIDTPDRGRIIAGDLVATALLLGEARRRPIVYNAHNIESSYDTNPYQGRPQRWRSIESWERLILNTMDESWMVSHRDIELARELAPGARLRYVPNVVDVEAIETSPAPGDDAIALMVADFTYPPNLDSARWLIDEVMPRVWDELPRARLRLTGRGLDADDLDARIDVTGFVPDIADAYAPATAVVVPLVEGAGSPLKFIEALAYGKSVIATSVAARGLEVESGVHFRLGDTPQAFAAALVDVLRARDPALGIAARSLAERVYSLQALERLLAPHEPVDATAIAGRDPVGHPEGR